MPKFLVSIVRGVARREVLEVSADSADEARWIALSSCDAWMDLDNGAVTVEPAGADASKVVTLKSAA
ncbi:hypothetical protein WV31_05020 [Magnetospirillum sp. ME-1]|uniref:hypothetical protein n=1 Tax=Magnetospirillum sp. ME-1 TaxID=1639348 RepID=UPI000A17E1B3|nr:hypothetical protein [Magnetospirillum sp. ME-1]ARJ65067.1 hypothetical protein WV31_05020 [Magnetospirillum sp. ME-1]